MKEQKIDFSGVENTALLTLYAKAIESASPNPILKDEIAEELVVRIDPYLKDMTDKMARQLVTRTIDPQLPVQQSLRTRKYDAYAYEYLNEHPSGTIVNLGCGLDARFFRLDNGKVHFFDLDLPAMIGLKKQLLEENDRYKMIAGSVLEHSWMDRLPESQEPFLILAEGIFMYLPEQEVRRLVLAIQKRFPGSELVCELTNRTWVEGFWGKMTRMKLKLRAKMGDDASFQFGVSTPQELEQWGPGIEFIDQWYYMDDNDPKVGWMRYFRKMMRNTQYTARYRLLAA